MNVSEKIQELENDPRWRLIHYAVNRANLWLREEDKLMIFYYLDQKITFSALRDYLKDQGQLPIDDHANDFIHRLRSYVPGN